MTVIAYRDGVMASDTGMWRGDAAFSCAKKLAKGADGTLYGICGNAARAAAFISWVHGGESDAMPAPVTTDARSGESDFVVLIARPGQPIEILTGQGVEQYDAPYFAIGACAEVCLGAMFAGADAETAIRAALEHGSGVHGRVEAVRLTP